MFAAVLLGFLALGLGGGLVLYLLVRAEHDKRETSSEGPGVPRTVRTARSAVSRDRRDAGRAAQRDSEDRRREW